MLQYAKSLSLLIILTTVTIANTKANQWFLEEESSNVRFIGALEGVAFRGRFKIFSADINFDPKNPQNGKIIGIVTMDSAESGDAERDGYLMEEDWFNPLNYPTSKFSSNSIEELKDGTFAAHGNLTIVGVTQPTTMVFSFNINGDGSAEFSGKFEVKRLLFGVGWDATNWIADEVSVQVALGLKQ